MTGKLKLALLLLALVALPLRGLAAVAMWHCEPANSHAAAHASEQSGHHDHGHAGDAGSNAHHGDHGDPASDHGNHGEPLGSAPDKSCSACSVCCLGGTIALAYGNGISVDASGAGRIAFFEPDFSGIVPPQLERPPHPRLP